MRFEQQLATARQLVPAAGAADREMARVLERADVPALEHVTRLHATLAELIGAPSLSRLHRDIPGFTVRAENGAHAEMKHQKQQMLAALADERRAAPFLAAYDALIRDVVAPNIDADSLHYSAFPTVRVQQPSAYAGIRPHCDAMYDLPAGSVNWWVALTHPLRPCRTLHVESAPGAGDFAPLLPPEGALVRFDGRRCLHFTQPNLSTRTRVSLDFRAVPSRYVDPSSRLARAGYWSVAARDDASGAYAKARAGRVSLYHGFPFTAKPEYDLVA